jgi:uncharacterized protein (TIGR04222 family)
MNPFDLSGPQFLAFYFVAGGVTLLALVLARRQSESGLGRVQLTDPYLIAHLRGGSHEALRVATVALVDRGLLVADGNWLSAASADGSGLVRHPVEQALLDKFRLEGRAAGVFTDPALAEATAELEQTLARHRLLPDDTVRRSRTGRVLIAVAFLWILGLIKLAVALSRGRTNVLFLVVLAGIFAAVAFRISRPRRTRAGDETLADLRTLFSGLKARRSSLSPRQSDEATLLAAVFGLGMLPAYDWAYARKLYPKAAGSSGTSTSSCSTGCGCASSWSSSVSSCGSSSSSSSCGSSGGSSCGSSCGGGGGGCGGCGS